MTSRLFIAIPLPKEVISALHSLQQGLSGARWVPEKQMHLTLRFLGDVEHNHIPLIKEQLGEISLPSFELTVHGVGCFPPRGTPRVLWAGLLPSTPLQTLAQFLDDKLAAAGFPPEPRSFSPHLTLARFRTVEPEEVKKYLAQHGSPSLPSFIVDQFILFSSSLSSAGAIHAPLGYYRLHS